MKQTIASDCAITGVCSAAGRFLAGVLGAGLAISAAGVLSGRGGPVKVDSDMNSSHTFNISNVNSSNLTAATLTVTNWSNFTGYNNTLNNISSTNLTCNSGSHTSLYGSTLRYDNLVPSGGYITNDVNNTNTTSTNINSTNFVINRYTL